MIRLISSLLLLIFIACSPVYKEITTHRDHYKKEFLQDPRSPLDSSDLKYLRFYPPSSKAQVSTSFIQTPDADPFDMPTYSGVTRSYRKWGEASFLWEGDSVKLAVYQNMTLFSNPLYADYLFLPFKDETNGLTTYGGGRYLNISKSDTEDGRLTIDFNKAYNPWCAYSEGFNCPIPPVENHLPFPVKAGEKMYKGQIRTK